MKSYYPLITFTTSFSTMCYAMIIASIVSDFTGEEIIAQCLTMGPYLLGLGLGSFFGDKTNENNHLKRIWLLEWISVILLPLIPTIILVLIFSFINFSPFTMSIEGPQGMKFIFISGGLFAFISGALGGAQLPIIIKMAKEIRNETILAVSYLGPLFSGPFIVLTTEKALSVATQIVIVGFIQIIGLIFIIGLKENRKFYLTTLVFPLSLLVLIHSNYSKFEYTTIKSSYMGIKLELKNLKELPSVFDTIQNYGALERIKTSYQTIDFLIEPAHYELERPSNATLYLNRKPQFDIFSIDVYHESMVFGGINLLGKTPEKVLILGGGDGLLLKELIGQGEIKKITMVELDPSIIEWASENPIISDLNKNVLSNPDPRAEIIAADAISFLRKHDKSIKYDLILIDFPFPNGHELAKLYSSEFYRLVKNVISPEGIITIDLPVQFNQHQEPSKETKVILKTLKTVGFENMLIFGPFASFLSVRADGKNLQFDYSQFPRDLSLSTKLNLVEIFNEDSVSDSVWQKTEVNSMFHPGAL